MSLTDKLIAAVYIFIAIPLVGVSLTFVGAMYYYGIQWILSMFTGG